jgi:hypothetical protein
MKYFFLTGLCFFICTILSAQSNDPLVGLWRMYHTEANDYNYLFMQDTSILEKTDGLQDGDFFEFRLFKKEKDSIYSADLHMAFRYPRSSSFKPMQGQFNAKAKKNVLYLTHVLYMSGSRTHYSATVAFSYKIEKENLTLIRLVD